MNQTKANAPTQLPFESRPRRHRKKFQSRQRGIKTADPRATKKCGYSTIAMWTTAFEQTNWNSGKLVLALHRARREERRSNSSRVTTSAAADQPERIIRPLRFAALTGG